MGFFCWFSTKYENLVPDYNFGTLVRTDAAGDYAQENTTLGSSFPLLACSRSLKSGTFRLMNPFFQ